MMLILFLCNVVDSVNQYGFHMEFTKTSLDLCWEIYFLRKIWFRVRVLCLGLLKF